MSKISFEVTPDESNLIGRIVDRTAEICKRHNIPCDKLNARMDLTACHANGTPLKLQELLNADDFNLLHDVSGIGRHINRETGQIEGHFRPRFAQSPPTQEEQR